jgi:hypothetical protein
MRWISSLSEKPVPHRSRILEAWINLTGVTRDHSGVALNGPSYPSGDPVHQSPQTRAYGFFAPGTVPPFPPLLLWLLFSSRSSSPAVFPDPSRPRLLGHPSFRRASGVGSEEARVGANLRPPLKLHVRFSRKQLSRRHLRETPTEGIDKVYKGTNLERARERVKANRGSGGRRGVESGGIRGATEPALGAVAAGAEREPISLKGCGSTPSRSGTNRASIECWASPRSMIGCASKRGAIGWSPSSVQPVKASTKRVEVPPQ